MSDNITIKLLSDSFYFRFLMWITIFFKSLIMKSAITKTTMFSIASIYTTFSFFMMIIIKMVFNRTTNLKIFWSVIKSIFIDMMNYFSFKKWSPNYLFHNNSMFIFPLTKLFDFNIRIVFCVVNNFCSFWFIIVMIFSFCISHCKTTAFRIKKFIKTFWTSFWIIPSFSVPSTIFWNNWTSTHDTIFFNWFSHNLINYHKRYVNVK